MPSLDTETALNLLTWAAGTGSAPAVLRERVEAALADVDLGYPPIDVESVVLRRVWDRVREQIPETASPQLSKALSGPHWSTAPARHPGLAERTASAAEHAIAELLPECSAAILAEARQEAEEHQRFMDGLKAEEHLRQVIENAAERVRWRRDAAIAHRRGTRMAVGALANVVKTADRPPVDMTRLSVLTGFSRPSLYKYAEEAEQAAQADDRNPEKATNEKLAEMHLAYEPEARPDVHQEFWARFPHLQCWYHAARWLLTTHVDAWWDTKGGFDPWSTDGPPDLPAYDWLMDKYRAMVAAIAAGLPSEPTQDT